MKHIITFVFVLLAFSAFSQGGKKITIQVPGGDGTGTDDQVISISNDTVFLENGGFVKLNPFDMLALAATTYDALDSIWVWDSSLDANRRIALGDLPGGSGEANTYSNAGVGGIGITLTKSGVDLPFKSIFSTSSLLTVADGGANNRVELTVEPNLSNYTNDLGWTTNTGTVTSVSSTTTNQLTVATPTTTPALTIVTGAVVDLGAALATGDQIYDFVTGQGYLTADATTASNGAIEVGDDIQLDINSLGTETAIAAGDFLPFWDITPTADDKKITFANFESTITITESQISDLNHTVNTDDQVIDVSTHLANGINLSLENDGEATKVIPIISTTANNDITYNADGVYVDVSANEVDGSITNEGSLTVVAGGANDSQIQSNTSGSTNITIAGTSDLTVTEAGSTITLTNTAPEATTVTDNPNGLDILKPANDITIALDMVELTSEASPSSLDSLWIHDSSTDSNRRIAIGDLPAGGDATTASNGLTEVGDDIRLGGTLTQNTTIDGSTNTYDIDFLNLDVFDVSDANTITLNSAGTDNAGNLIINNTSAYLQTDDTSDDILNYVGSTVIGGSEVSTSQKAASNHVTGLYTLTPDSSRFIIAEHIGNEDYAGIILDNDATDLDMYIRTDSVNNGVDVTGMLLTGINASGLTEWQTLNTSGDWIGTFDGQEGTFYLDRANHTGTQLLSTISDVTATAAELNLLDLAGLTDGWVLSATGATTASWSQLNTSDLNNDSGFLTAEVDGSITNEGSLTVLAGTATTSIISSNTSGSTDVTLTAGTNMSISEAGNVITLNNTAPEATTVNDLGNGLDIFKPADEITIALDMVELTSEASPVNSDSLWIHDSSADANRRVAIGDLPIGGADNLGNHTATEIIKSETFGIQFNGTGQTIIGDAGGLTLDIPTGDTYDFEINNAVEFVVDGNNIELFGNVGAFGATTPGTNTLRLNDVGTTPSGTLTNGGLLYVSGTSIFFHADDGTATDLTIDNNTQLTEEQVQDFAWNVLTGTQTLITVTYQDGTDDVDFEVEPNLSNYTDDLGHVEESTTASAGVIEVGNDIRLDINSLPTETTIAAGDFVPFWDITATADDKKITFGNFEAALSITQSQISDVTATAAELNLLDLSGLTTGWVLRATGATTAAWQQLAGSDINNDLGWTNNTGTVTSVATGPGLTGGPITTTGTLDLDMVSLTSEPTPVATDSIWIHDSSADANRRVAVGDLPSSADNLGNHTATQDLNMSNNDITNLDAAYWNTAFTAPTHSEGITFYDQNEHTLNVYNDEADVTHQLGQEGYIRVYNNSGVTITNGQVVYITGNEGVEFRPTVDLARSDVRTTSEVIGIATHDIENNTFGYVTYWGRVNNLNTSAFAAGDVVYLDETTAGALRNSVPPEGNYEILIGYVVRSHATLGAIQLVLNPDLGLPSGDANELVINVQKGSAGTINAGQVVYISGYDVGANFTEVELAEADVSASMPALGIARDAITNTQEGLVVVSGQLINQNTSAYSVGDELYVDITAGGLTNVKPTGAGTLIQKIGIVARSHVSQGVIEVFGAGRANDLPNLTSGNIWLGNGSDVPTETSRSGIDDTAIHDNVAGEINAITEKVTPVAGDWLLIEDSGDATNKKKIQIGNLPTHTGTQGGIFFADTDGTPTDDPTQLFWDNTNNELGLGTNTPASTFLHVVGTSAKHTAILETSSSATAIGTHDPGLELVNTDQTAGNWAKIFFTDAAAGAASGAIGMKFTDHTNNYGALGFYTRASDGFNERMIIDTIGRIGIGTSVPAEELSLHGTGDTYIKIQGGTNLESGIKWFEAGVERSRLYFDGANNTFEWDRFLGNADFLNNGTSQLFLEAGGQIGINQTAPGQILHIGDNLVAGTQYIRFENDQEAYDLGVQSGGQFRINKLAGGVTSFTIDPSNDFIMFNQYGLGNKTAASLSKTLADYVFRPATDGTVLEQTLADFVTDLNTEGGIQSGWYTNTGGTNPASAYTGQIFHGGTVSVYDAGASVSHIDLITNTTSGYIYSVSVLDSGIEHQTNSTTRDFIFLENANELMRIESSTGNVGINTSNPTSQFEVSGTLGSFKVEDVGTTLTLTRDNNNIIDANGGLSSAQLLLRTNGSTAITIGSTQNVGIGTTNPNTKLDIIGGAGSQLRLSTTEADVTTKASYISQRHYTNAEEDFSLFFGNSTSSANTVVFGGGSGTQNAATSISFYTAANNTTLTGTNRMVIDTIGRVGIGTSNPSNTLDIVGVLEVDKNGVNSIFNGTTDARNEFTINGTRYGLFSWSSSGILFEADNGGVISFREDGAGDDAMTIDVQGEVGIGTSNPGALLHINDTGLSDIRLSDADAALDEKNWDIQFGSTVSDLFRIRAVNDAVSAGENALTISRTGTTIDDISFPNGQVGIGTTSPLRTLHVGSTAVTTDGVALQTDAARWDYLVSTSERFIIRDVTSGNIDPLIIEQGASNNQLFLESGGQIGIGTTTPDAQLTVADGNVEIGGDVGAFGATTAGDHVLRINDVVTIPAGTMTSGGLLYVDGINLWFMDDAGTKTNILVGGSADNLGNHTATQDLQMVTFNIDFQDVGQSIGSTTSGIVFDVPTGDTYEYQINDVVEYTFSNTQLNVTNSDIINIDDFLFNVSGIAIQTSTSGMEFDVPTGDNFRLQIQNADKLVIDENNIELFGNVGSYGATTPGTNTLRINDVGTVPVGTLTSGGLLYVTGTELHFLADDGTDTNVLTGTGDNLGNHTMTQDLQVGTNNIDFQDAGQLITSNIGGLSYEVPAGDEHRFIINASTEFLIQSTSVEVFTDFDVGVNNILFTDVGQTLGSTAGGIVYDVPTADIHLFQVNSATIATIDANGLDMGTSVGSPFISIATPAIGTALYTFDSDTNTGIGHSSANDDELSIISGGNISLISNVAGASANIELFGNNGLYGATTAGQGVLRFNDVTQAPVGTMTNGGLLFVSGTALNFHDDAGVTTDLTSPNKHTHTRSITIESPTATDDIVFWRATEAVTITAVHAVLDGTTSPSVTWQIQHNANRTVDTDLFTANKTTTNTTTGVEETATFNDATVADNEWVRAEITAVSGTVNSITLIVEYTVD